jgi:hypothetical protein
MGMSLLWQMLTPRCQHWLMGFAMQGSASAVQHSDYARQVEVGAWTAACFGFAAQHAMGWLWWAAVTTEARQAASATAAGGSGMDCIQ